MSIKLIEIILLFIGAYLIGSVPFGLIAGKVTKGVDVREYGSGNIGATNVIRVCGKPIGYCVFFLDVVKGFLPTFLTYHIAKHMGFSQEIVGLFAVISGVLSVLGHSFSCFLKFKGGKGVCTSLGVIIGLNWLVAAIGYGIFLIVLLISRYVSLGSIIATFSVPFMFISFKYFNAPLSYKVLAVILFIAIFLKHIPNMKRLANGTESKFKFKSK